MSGPGVVSTSRGGVTVLDGISLTRGLETPTLVCVSLTRRVSVLVINTRFTVGRVDQFPVTFYCPSVQCTSHHNYDQRFSKKNRCVGRY